MAPERAVVVGLGSSLRGDDGIGPRVARELKKSPMEALEIVEAAGDPAALLEALAGARLAVIVDAAVSGAAPGTVLRLDWQEFRMAAEIRAAAASTHGFDLRRVLELAEALGQSARKTVIYAVEAGSLGMGGKLSAATEAVIRDLAARIAAEISADPA